MPSLRSVDATDTQSMHFLLVYDAVTDVIGVPVAAFKSAGVGTQLQVDVHHVSVHFVSQEKSFATVFALVWMVTGVHFLYVGIQVFHLQFAVRTLLYFHIMNRSDMSL